MAGIAKRATIQTNLEINGMDKLKQLNNTMDRITQRNSAMKRSFANTSDQLSRFNDIASDFGKKYKDMMEQTTTSNQDFSRTSKEMSKQFQASQEDIQNSINQTKRLQNESADSTVSDNNRISRSHRSVGNEVERTSGKMNHMNHVGHNIMMTGMNMTMGLGGFTAAAKEGIQEATNLQDQYNKVRILAQNGGENPNESRTNTAALQRQGEKLSTTYGIDQEQLSQGNEDLIRRGYTTNAAKGSQPEYSKASLASGDDYNDVVQTGAGAVEAFGQRSNNAKKMHNNTKKMLNQLTYGADLTASDYKDLGWALQYTGSVAHQSRQSSNETIANLGELSQQNITGSKAGTSMRRLIEGLSNPKQGTLNSIGLSPKDLQDSHGNLKSITDDMQILNDHMQGMTSTQRQNVFKSLFGMEGEQAAQILAGNSKAVRDLNQNIKNAPNMDNGQGYNTRVASQNMQSFKGQSNIAKQNFKAMQASIAGSMLPDLAKIVGWANGIFKKMNGLSKGTKRNIGWSATIAGLLAPTTVIVGSLVASIQSIISAMRKVRNMFSKKMPRTATNSMASQAAENDATSSLLNNSSSNGYSGSSSSKLGRDTSDVTKAGRDVRGVGRLSRVERNSSRLSRLNPFTSTKSAGTFSNIGRDASDVSKVGKLGKLAKFGGHAASILSIGTSLLDLIGINKKNAGQKIGSTGGSIAGGAAGTGIGSVLGSFIAPGAGTAVGGALGGGLGSMGGEKLGGILGKMVPEKDVDKVVNNFHKISREFGKMTKPIRQAFHSVAKSFGDMVKSWNNSTFGQVINSSVIESIKGLGRFVSWFIKGNSHAIVGFSNWLLKYAKSGFQTISGVFQGAFKSLSGIFETFSGLFSGNWSKMWDGIKNTFGGVIDILKSMTNGAWQSIANTFGGIGNTVAKTFDWMVTKAQHAGEMMLHPIKAARGELDFQRQETAQEEKSNNQANQKRQQRAQANVLNGSALNSQTPKDDSITRWEPMVKSNLKRLHLSTSKGMVNKVLRQINTESSGVSSRIGGNDGDPRNGNASGLLQVKPTTFNQYGSKNGQLMNPNDNIYAALNYGKSRYGKNLSGLGNIGKNGIGIGFGNGGWSSSPAIFGEVSGQPEVAINPAKSTADGLIQQAIQARAKYAKPKSNKQSTKSMQGNISSMMSGHKSSSKQPVQITQNFNISGNADKSTVNNISQTTKQAVKQVINEFMAEKNDAMFNS